MIRRFEKEDWSAITDPTEEWAVVADNLDLTDRGYAITVIDEEGIIGCGGVILYDDENGEMWVRLSKRVNLVPLKALKYIFESMKILLETFSDVYISCRVDVSFQKAHKLVTWLGFKWDGETMDFNDRTFLIYRL